MEGHRLFEGCATGGTQQDVGRDQGCANFGSLQGRVIVVAEPCWTGIFRVGFSELRKPSASFTTRRQEGVVEHTQESGITVLPDLLFEAHVCLSADDSGRVTSYDCSNAWTFIHSDRPQVCAGDG